MKYFAFLFVIISLCTPAAAQETRARITGVVSDGQGAVVPGVTVTALNTDTNVSTEAVTNASGAFTIQQLVPGPYRITAALQGFKTFVREGIELHTAETVTVNVPLTVGALEETVTVSAQTTAIESNETHDLADDREQAHLGAAAQRPAGLHADAADRRHDLHPDDVRRDRLLGHARVGRQRLALRSTAAAPATTSSWSRARRAPGTGGGTGNWNYAPPVDAIEEFKIGTSSVDASFGRTSGGVINMTLRSGTNQLRGSGILLHRGTWLDSNQIQNIRNNISNKEHKYFNARRHGQRADSPATRPSSWAATRGSTRTSPSR